MQGGPVSDGVPWTLGQSAVRPREHVRGRLQQGPGGVERPVQDEHQLAGSAIGGLVGGVVGNQFGGGSGKTLATVAGALGGGYAGNKVQERLQDGDTCMTTQRRCETVNDTQSETVGFKVRYRVDGQSHEVRLDEKPDGERVPLRDGKPRWDEVTSS